jgi:hypothetical protein
MKNNATYLNYNPRNIYLIMLIKHTHHVIRIILNNMYIHTLIRRWIQLYDPVAHHEFYWDSVEGDVYWTFPSPMDKYDGPRLCCVDELRTWTESLERAVRMTTLAQNIENIFRTPTATRLGRLAKDLLELGKLRYQVSKVE